MKITKIDSLEFSRLSKDNNKIHFDKKYSSKFFFKEPVAHGINMVLLALSIFLKKQKYPIIIKKLDINFLNYLLLNESFEVKVYKKKILVIDRFNTKIEIEIKKIFADNFEKQSKRQKKVLKKYKIKKLCNPSIIFELLNISRHVGSIKPGNGSLIHKVIIEKEDDKSKNKFKITKRTKSIYIYNYIKNGMIVEITASKLTPFVKRKSKMSISSKVLNKIKEKKILVFGASGDLASRIYNSEIKRKTKLFEHSFRISADKPHINKSEKFALNKKINSIKPDLILYLSSPKIFYGTFKKNNNIYYFYKSIFATYFLMLLKIVIKSKIKCKIFYPSTIFLNNIKKFKRLECYLKAKADGERICRLKGYSSIVYKYRIPQLKSRSNYNMLGFYEGEDLSVIDKYYEDFFNKISS